MDGTFNINHGLTKDEIEFAKKLKQGENQAIHYIYKLFWDKVEPIFKQESSVRHYLEVTDEKTIAKRKKGWAPFFVKKEENIRIFLFSEVQKRFEKEAKHKWTQWVEANEAVIFRNIAHNAGISDRVEHFLEDKKTKKLFNKMVENILAKTLKYTTAHCKTTGLGHIESKSINIIAKEYEHFENKVIAKHKLAA